MAFVYMQSVNGGFTGVKPAVKNQKPVYAFFSIFIFLSSA
jgi:hypothetical protein